MKDWLLNQICTHGVIASAIAEFVLIVGLFCAAGAALNAISRHQTRHRAHRTPAAPDNQPGTDPELLSACRHIAAQPTASREEKP